MLSAVVEAVAEVLEDAPGEVVACGLDHQGESVLAWDAESGAPLSPIVTWQDKRSQEILDRLEADGQRRRGARAQRHAARPLLLRRQARVAARERRGGGAGPRSGHPAHGHGRLVPLRPARRGLRDRPLDRFAHPARRPRLGPARCSSIFGVPARVAAGDHGHRRRPRHAAPSLLARRAAAAGALPRPAGGARRRGLRRARPGEGHLRDRRVRPRPRGRRAPASRAAACCRRSPGASTGASSGRSTAASSRPARCSSGSAATSALPPTRPRSPRPPREVEDAGGVRVLPALAGVGAPWWRARGARRDRRDDRRGRGRRTSRARRWRRSPGGSPTCSPRPRDASPVEVLRVDGGLTRDPTLLQLQADAAGVPVQRGAVDATAAGAAALAAVGAGIWGSTLEIAERIPAGERTEPKRDDAWRERAHAEWRAVRRASGRSEPSLEPPQISPARMCSVPSMCSRISCTARAASPRRSSADQPAGAARSSASAPARGARSGRSGRSSDPAPRSSPSTRRGERAASAIPMWKRMSARRYSSNSCAPAIFFTSSSRRSSCSALGPLGRQDRGADLDRHPVVEHRPGLLAQRLASRSASGGRSATNVPPLRPRGETRWPLCTSVVRARRSVEREIPQLAGEARARTAGGCPEAAGRGGSRCRAARPSPRTSSAAEPA